MRAQANAHVEFVKVDISPDKESARQVAIVAFRVRVKRLVKKEKIFKPPHHPHPSPKKEIIYIVRSGDTIWKISRMFGVPMEAIIAANNLKNPDLIFPGQKLIIPK
ncbi:MAG TPA: LysM peptidoglycan-binding domain-containing protein [Firmicutes bacterium]|nr:LysM peptidoglycan-binding domain-containing protein [Bacillota bacterium]